MKPVLVSLTLEKEAPVINRLENTHCRQLYGPET